MKELKSNTHSHFPTVNFNFISIFRIKSYTLSHLLSDLKISLNQTELKCRPLCLLRINHHQRATNENPKCDVPMALLVNRCDRTGHYGKERARVYSCCSKFLEVQTSLSFSFFSPFYPFQHKRLTLFSASVNPRRGRSSSSSSR